MEDDDSYRSRIVLAFRQSWNFGRPDPTVEGDIALACGSKLDEWGDCYHVVRIRVGSDPFGDAVRAAQKLQPEDEIIPHPVKRPETKAEIDDLWASIVEVGRAG